MPIPIMAKPSIDLSVLKLQSENRNATSWFRNAIETLWCTGCRTGVDPSVLVAQCAHETGWGKFGGAVRADFGNTAGIKVRNPNGDKPEDHAQFAMSPDGFPWQGALAHAHHLMLYCGILVPLDTPDPRASHIWKGTSLFGSVVYVEDLGGKWAPNIQYGYKIADIVKYLKFETDD